MIKEYHVSENLFDKDNTTIYNAYFAIDSESSIWIPSEDSRSIKIPCEPNTQYTLSLSSAIPIFRICASSNANIEPSVSGVRVRTLIRSENMQEYTFTTSANDAYIIFQGSASLVYEWFNSLMLNLGSTALPYEPYGNTWNTKSYCKATTGSKTYSNFPIAVRSQEQSISSWNMKGNEQHTGTASPTNPIEINGTGERTANLLDFTALATASAGSIPDITFTFEHLLILTVEPNTTYTLSSTGTGSISGDALSNRSLYFGGTDFSSVVFAEHPVQYTTSDDGKLYIGFVSSRPNATQYLNGTAVIMLNSGSTALPYEPYGYKIPISANGTALTPVYLTEQLMKINDYADRLASSGSLIRYIKKIELKGTEGWTTRAGTPANIFFCERSDTNFVNNCALCTHYINQDEGSFNDMQDKHILVRVASSGDKTYIGIRDSSYPQTNEGASQLASYLAEQYAAGTPVTVYYVIETTVTEQVTVPTIPTISSPTTIDVNTSVKPSEMSLTYDGYKICKPTKIVIPEPSEWIAKSWNGYNRMVGSSIWSDGNNIYYSMAMDQYILNKSTSTWSAKTWNGLTSFNGAHIWTDGDNIYYSFGNDQYVLNRQTSTWSAKTWNGLASFDGGYVWTDGNNVYYSNSSNQYILDKATSTWVEKEWNGLTSFDGSDVWFEGNNIYYSHYFTRYILNKSTSTWSEKAWTNAPYYMYGVKIWSVNGYTFYSNGTYEQYVLDKSTSTWSTKTWTGFTSFSGGNIWTDGTNIYASDGIGKQYVLVR